MKKDISNNSKSIYTFFALGFIIELAVTAVFIVFFAIVMFFAQWGYEYATVLATVSIGAGCFVSSIFVGAKIGEKGILNGAVIGFATFVIVTLISLIADDSSVTLNTLFHFIIMMLSSLIGGIIGVNKKVNKKYI